MGTVSDPVWWAFWAQLAFVIAVLAVVYIPLGDYMARVYSTDGPLRTRDTRVERALYRVCRIDPTTDQTAFGYGSSLLGFSLASLLFLYALQRLQHLLPFSGGQEAVSPSVAFNTTISFVANTNWQSYTPETTMSHLTQSTGLAVQNFVSGAVGMAVAIALIRGFVRVRAGGRIGNFWVDLVRGSLRILLPIAFLIALVLLAQGVVMSYHYGFASTGLDGSTVSNALAPVASQEAIKELGTNGGGILGANSAHPFENPTPLTNVVEILAILVIPVALTRTFGTLVGDRRQGLTVLGVMGVIWLALLAVVTVSETTVLPEGKEVRFGVFGTSLFATTTTGTSTGAVNAAHDSLSPLGGGTVMLNMLLGEIAPGGVGTGLYGILVLAVIAVFVGGLLVGRTPEMLGKSLGRKEITCAALAVLVMPTLVLTGTGISVILDSTRDAQTNSGDPGTVGSIHGFSEVLYAFASASNNNGSAFGGLTVTSPWFQISLGLAMLFGRFLTIALVLALAGRLASARRVPAGAGTLPTHGPLFGSLLVGVVGIVAALTFFPALALGPIAEALA